jgi:PAS domain S-box-containing protein
MISALEKLSWPKRYGAGVALATVALILQWTLSHWVQHRIPFLLFIPTVALCAALLGQVQAMTVFLVGLLYGGMMLAPAGQMLAESLPDRISLLAYAAVSLFFILVGDHVRKVALRAAHTEQVLFEERLRMQQMAQENDARFRTALDSSAMPFTILAPVKDGAGRIVDFRWAYVNPAAPVVLGRSQEQLIGKLVNEVLPGSWDEPGLFERYVAVSTLRQSQTFELHSRANGIEGWFQVVASPLQDAVVIWFADVSPQKRQEQALREADQRKDEFLAVLAHELRNPLAPIRQAAALSRRPDASEQQRRWSAEVIERQVGNMALLLDDLMDVSRITRGKLTLKKTLTELKQVIDTALETTQPLLLSKRQHLALTMPPRTVLLDADALRLAQVVANLLTNAAKYTDAGGEIGLRADAIDGDVVIAVSDNGIGISEADCERIFDMFVQIGSARDRTHGGLGIGLALSRGLVELHGGRINVESGGPGKGSRFTVRLPAALRRVLPDCAMNADPAAAAAARKVLIADDNRDAADTLAALVELEGHQVQVTYDGAEALSAFADFEPDIVLLDIGMPCLSGIEVACRIRAIASGRNVTLVAITGWGQSADRASTMAAGFNHHLTKPVDAAVLRTLLAGSQLKIETA